MPPGDVSQLNEAAAEYVKIVLALGEHDRDYVDAYYGTEEWREQVRAEKASLDEIRARAVALIERLGGERLSEPQSPTVSGGDSRADERAAAGTAAACGSETRSPQPQARRAFLRRQTAALLARVEILGGRRMSFDEESEALYDAVAPHYSEEHFRGLLRDLDGELPGRGSVPERLEAFRQRFTIPREKLDGVFSAAIDEGRSRTLEHIALPANESFTVEYVTGKNWSGYNWYQGGCRSLIQVNTDLPITIDRAVDLACHEGYPGHHVFNSLLETHLVRERGWMEFTVYPLYTPQSLIAEGSANYGIEVALPGKERVEFEKGRLFPLAGLDASEADRYYRTHALTDRLSYAGNEAARRYLDGAFDAPAAVEWLQTYALMSPARASQRVKFFDQYRSYVINYNLGKDLVRAHVESRRGDRWRVFEDLLSAPVLPSDL